MPFIPCNCVADPRPLPFTCCCYAGARDCAFRPRGGIYIYTYIHTYVCVSSPPPIPVVFFSSLSGPRPRRAGATPPAVFTAPGPAGPSSGGARHAGASNKKFGGHTPKGAHVRSARMEVRYEQALVSLLQNSTANVEGGRTKAVIIEGG